jgi:hypothetical protein
MSKLPLPSMMPDEKQSKQKQKPKSEQNPAKKETRIIQLISDNSLCELCCSYIM